MQLAFPRAYQTTSQCRAGSGNVQYSGGPLFAGDFKFGMLLKTKYRIDISHRVFSLLWLMFFLSAKLGRYKKPCIESFLSI